MKSNKVAIIRQHHAFYSFAQCTSFFQKKHAHACIYKKKIVILHVISEYGYFGEGIGIYKIKIQIWDFFLLHKRLPLI